MKEYKIIEHSNGTKEWYLNGKRHKEDGPAIEYANGTKAWYLNGKLHREDGPAIEWPDGAKEWWLNGENVTEEEVMNKPNVINNDSYYTVAIKCNNCYHKFKVNFIKGTVSFNNVVKCVNCDVKGYCVKIDI